jgi:calcium/calmodulin-dependent protein kinase I
MKFTDSTTFQREMDNLLYLEKTGGGHHNICLMREHFDDPSDPDHFYLILDLIEGGELFEHLSQYGAYSEKDAARVIRQTASALAFLHGIGLVHSDLKPEVSSALHFFKPKTQHL